MNSEDGQDYSVCILQYSCFTKYNMQSKHKQNVNIADETLTDYSFLRRYQELFEKTISNSSLNPHDYWDLYQRLVIKTQGSISIICRSPD